MKKLALVLGIFFAMTLNITQLNAVELSTLEKAAQNSRWKFVIGFVLVSICLMIISNILFSKNKFATFIFVILSLVATFIVLIIVGNELSDTVAMSVLFALIFGVINCGIANHLIRNKTEKNDKALYIGSSVLFYVMTITVIMLNILQI